MSNFSFNMRFVNSHLDWFFFPFRRNSHLYHDGSRKSEKRVVVMVMIGARLVLWSFLKIKNF